MIELHHALLAKSGFNLTIIRCTIEGVIQGRPSQNGFFQSLFLGRFFKFLHDFLPPSYFLRAEFS